MKNIANSRWFLLALISLFTTLFVGFLGPVRNMAQDKAPEAAQSRKLDAPKAHNEDLAAQVRQLKEQIDKLEAALDEDHKGVSSSPTGTKALGGGRMGMMRRGRMGGMDKMGMGRKADEEMMGRMGEMGMGGKSDMGMMERMDEMGMSTMSGSESMMDMDESMGMMGMKRMGRGGMMGMGRMKMTSALPGFPGASRIYHIGATDFFLDHPEHITLTTEQQVSLNALKEKALLDRSTRQRKIDESEQELWTLTASDQPDAAKIEAKVHEIEKLLGDQRMAFIRTVGEAAKVLTDEQREALLGTAEKTVEPTAGKSEN